MAISVVGQKGYLCIWTINNNISCNTITIIKKRMPLMATDTIITL